MQSSKELRRKVETIENQAIPKLERKLRAIQDEYSDLNTQKMMLSGENEVAYT